MRTQLHQIVGDSARRLPDSSALTYKDTTVTYAHLWDEVAAVANGLGALGLRRGDRVAIYLEKRIETVTTIFGTSAAGGVFVPVNPILKAKQVAYILADCSVRVLVTTPERLEVLREELAGTAVEHVIVLGAAPAIDGLIAHAWDEFCRAGAYEEPDVIDIEMAAILYTSGSTGKPKGVVLSHRNLLIGGASVSQYLENHGDDVILAALPL